jgi:4-carboxymuconolactone decarboxylase
MTAQAPTDERRARGMALLQRLFRGRTSGAPLAPAFAEMTIDHLFGDVWSRPGLAVEERSLATCAVLIALGRESEQRLHFRGARNLGIARERLDALITHVAHYAGWPVAVSAFRVLDEVWKEMDAEGGA